ncbi:MAG TPA: energy transducer TonB [Bacteroidales bacterium]|nr:energy transducer TonB [Bacteroidales bacterium]
MYPHINLKPVLTVLFFILIVTGSAAALEPSGSCAAQMYSRLKETVTYPPSAVRDQLEGEVVVIFQVSDEGKLKVYNVYTTNPELSAYVRNRLSSLYCELPEAHNRYFKVKFNFRLI